MPVEIPTIPNGLDALAKLRTLEDLGEIKLNELETRLVRRLYLRLERCSNIQTFSATPEEEQQLTEILRRINNDVL